MHEHYISTRQGMRGGNILNSKVIWFDGKTHMAVSERRPFSICIFSISFWPVSCGSLSKKCPEPHLEKSTFGINLVWWI